MVDSRPQPGVSQVTTEEVLDTGAMRRAMASVFRMRDISRLFRFEGPGE